MIRLLFPHGIGDCVQALPALRRFAEKRGDLLEIGVLKRLPAAREIMEAQSFVDEVFDLEDPWRDGPERFGDHMREFETLCDGRLIWTRRPKDPSDARISKAVRIAAELGVDFVPENPWPIARAVGGERSRVVRLHGSSGNPSKDVRLLDLAGIGAQICRKVAPDLIDTSDWSDFSVATNRDLCSAFELVVGIDSGPAHLASCVDGLPVIWVFKCTPIQQAIPLWRDVAVCVVGPAQEMLIDSWWRWVARNPSLVKHRVEIHRGDLHA